jgi:hypothetical protein
MINQRERSSRCALDRCSAKLTPSFAKTWELSGMKYLLSAAVICLLITSAHAGGSSQDNVPLGANGRDDGVNWSGPGAAPYRPAWPFEYTAFTSQGVRIPFASLTPCNGRDDGMCPPIPPSGSFYGPYNWSLTGQTQYTSGP